MALNGLLGPGRAFLQKPFTAKALTLQGARAAGRAGTGSVGFAMPISLRDVQMYPSRNMAGMAERKTIGSILAGSQGDIRRLLRRCSAPPAPALAGSTFRHCYTDPTITAGSTMIRATHIMELRAGTQ